MWDNTVVTAGGSQLLSQWVDGSVLNITGAVGGTGTVDAGVLKDQTALADQKQVLSIIGREDVPGGIKLSVQITAPAVGYTLNQIGILGNINGGATTLIAIYQDATGEPIPASSTIPDYVYTFYATITTTNVGELTVTVDPSALVTATALASAIAVHNLNPDSHLDKLSVSGDGSNVTVGFAEAAALEHIQAGEKLSTLFGKIKKWLTSLGAAAFKGVGVGASDVAAGNHNHGNMSNTGKYGEAANFLIGTGIGGTAEVKTLQQDLDILKLSNRNLLINWDFQVWQRGEALTPDAQALTADCWKIHQSGFTVTKQIDADGRPYIRIVNTSGGPLQLYFYQPLENYAMFAGVDMTASARIRGYNGYAGPIRLRAGGNGYNNVSLTPSWQNASETEIFAPAAGDKLTQGLLFYTITTTAVPAGQGVEIKAAKLETGAVTTLANDPPVNYGEQLAQCQRYALALPTGRYVRACYVSLNTIQFLIPLPVSLRAQPTIGAGAFQVQTLDGIDQSDFAYTVSSAKPNSILIAAAKTAHGLSDACLYVQTPVLLSAEI
jgi:hypothetical protein